MEARGHRDTKNKGIPSAGPHAHTQALILTWLLGLGGSLGSLMLQIHNVNGQGLGTTVPDRCPEEGDSAGPGRVKEQGWGSPMGCTSQDWGQVVLLPNYHCFFSQVFSRSRAGPGQGWEHSSALDRLSTAGTPPAILAPAVQTGMGLEAA